MSKMTSEQRRAFWQDRIDRCQLSSLTIDQFCKQEHCSPGSFYHWKRLLANSDARQARTVREQSSSKKRDSKSSSRNDRFIPVATGDVATTFLLRLPGGACFELPNRFDGEMLRTLVEATIEVSCQHLGSEDDV